MQYDGTNLMIASNNGQGTEMCYWFKHCMHNQIFTFFRVGHRAASGTSSSTQGIAASQGITWLNSAASSDNIGPVGVVGYGDFVGANHPWRKAGANGEKGKGDYTTIRTATCDSMTIACDGKLLTAGTHSECDCKRIEVNVWNTLMDPLVEPDDSMAVLNSPLIIEHVTYTVQSNSIAVAVEHRYLKDFAISRYYGMQSMFIGEEYIMTPSGASPTWSYQSLVGNFKKGAYPEFNRYLEMNHDGWMQSAWLRQRDLGLHGQLAATSLIYAHGSGKSYHVLVDNKPVESGSIARWSGVYTWVRPLANDSTLLAYEGIIDGHEALYIDLLAPGSRQLQLPAAWHGCRIEECTPSASISASGNTIVVEAYDAASVIVVRSPDGDLNNDGIIDIDDINLLINAILKKTPAPHPSATDIDNSGSTDIDDLNMLVNAVLNSRS